MTLKSSTRNEQVRIISIFVTPGTSEILSIVYWMLDLKTTEFCLILNLNLDMQEREDVF